MKKETTIKWMALFIAVFIIWLPFRVYREIKKRPPQVLHYTYNLPDLLNRPSVIDLMKGNRDYYKLKILSSPRDSNRIHYLANQNVPITYSENSERLSSTETTSNNYIPQIFWVKVGFSGILTLAALYVILSKRYNPETRKWAFDALTLIAGVWIGTYTV